jgi:hypothetical protein
MQKRDEVIIRQIFLKPGMKDSNIQVVAQVCKCLSFIIEQHGISDSLCVFCLPGNKSRKQKT